MNRILAILSLIIPGLVFAGGETNIRSLGMGKTGVTHALGIDAAKWNPARLAASREKLPIQIKFASPGFIVANNSINVRTYNNFFFRKSGDYLSQTEQEDLLLSIDDLEGFNSYLTGEATILAYAQNNFSLHINSVGHGNVSVPKNLFSYVLEGNSKDYKNLAIDGAKGTGFGGAEFALNYGFKLPKSKRMKILTAGIGLRYFQGLSYVKIVEAKGGFITVDSTSSYSESQGYYNSGFPINEPDHIRDYQTTNQITSLDPNNPYKVSRLSYIKSGGGKTVLPIVDLGFYTEIKGTPRTAYGFSLLNVFGSKVKWNKNPEFKYYEFYSKPNFFTVDTDSIDFVKADSTIKIKSFESVYPSTARIGFARLYPNYTLAFEIEKGLTEGSISYFDDVSLNFGYEYRAFDGMFPLRTGLVMGGIDGFSFTLGTGIHSHYFDFDIAYGTQKKFTFDGNGVSFGFSFTAKIY
ncbi:hypothetical protein IT568_04550 [bacterium]|nr:hypothetical protein [bacterium]